MFNKKHRSRNLIYNTMIIKNEADSRGLSAFTWYAVAYIDDKIFQYSIND